MPPIFKALATIAVWILFIGGCVWIVGGFAALMGAPGPPGTAPVPFRFAGGGGFLVLSVVVMKLRQKME